MSNGAHGPPFRSYAGPVLEGWLILGIVVALVGGVCLFRLRTDGHFRSRRGAAAESVAAESGAPSRNAGDRQVVHAAEIGSPLGERATVLQFSSAFCAPCRTTRTLLTQVVADLPGVEHVEIDAEAHLDLVRRSHVLRTPTVLILDSAGTVVNRASGVPRRDELLSVIETSNA